MARPRREMTVEEVAELETLAAVLNQQQIADYFGMAPRTFRDILNRDDEVSAAYKKGKAKAIAFVAQGLLRQARDGSLGASIFYLKTQGGWKETAPDPVEAPPTRIELTARLPDQDNRDEYFDDAEDDTDRYESH